jgi:hypothetical protein
LRRSFYLVIVSKGGTLKGPTYDPQIYYDDINKDEKKELIIILTKGYGTGALEQEVNVFHIDTNRFGEVLVDHPMAIVNKNIKTTLTP